MKPPFLDFNFTIDKVIPYLERIVSGEEQHLPRIQAAVENTITLLRRYEEERRYLHLDTLVEKDDGTQLSVCPRASS